MTNTQARQTEQQDIGAIIVAHRRLLKRLASRFTGGGVQHDDLVQEGAIALWRASEKWRGEASLWTYARRAVFHAMLRAASAELEAASLCGVDPETIAVDDDAEIATLIRECFSILDETERTVVSLRMAGRTYEEIGDVLGRDEKIARTIFAGAVAILSHRAAS